MNTANLQLEGLLLALSSLIELLKRKELLSEQEIDEALIRAEQLACNDPGRPAELREANVDAICFPIRFLRLAAKQETAEHQGFSEIAAAVGRDER